MIQRFSVSTSEFSGPLSLPAATLTKELCSAVTDHTAVTDHSKEEVKLGGERKINLNQSLSVPTESFSCRLKPTSHSFAIIC